MRVLLFLIMTKIYSKLIFLYLFSVFSAMIYKTIPNKDRSMIT